MADLIETDAPDPDDAAGDLRVGPTVVVPAALLRIKFVRSGGPGGQNVNKVSTAAQLRVRLAELTMLDPAARHRLADLAGSRLTEGGEIVMSADAGRSQSANRRDVLDRLADLIRRALVRPKARRKTKVSRAAKRRRVEGKRRRSETKSQRGAVRGD